MFDSRQITQDLSIQISTHLSRTLKSVFDPDSKPSANLDKDSLHQLMQGQSALADNIRLLVRIANGEIPGDLADDILVDEVEEALQAMLKVLFASPANPQHYEIPSPFWNTEFGQVIQHCQLWLRGDDLISYTEAAGILWTADDVQTARMRIKRMVERGELTAYIDPTERNPQRAARVSRLEVEAYQ